MLTVHPGEGEVTATREGTKLICQPTARKAVPNVEASCRTIDHGESPARSFSSFARLYIRPNEVYHS